MNHDEDRITIPCGDLEALLAIAAWAAREHGDSLPEALLVPAGDVLARYDVHLDCAPLPGSDPVVTGSSGLMMRA
jgi:hypothetical protein